MKYSYTGNLLKFQTESAMLKPIKYSISKCSNFLNPVFVLRQRRSKSKVCPVVGNKFLLRGGRGNRSHSNRCSGLRESFPLFKGDFNNAHSASGSAVNPDDSLTAGNCGARSTCLRFDMHESSACTHNDHRCILRRHISFHDPRSERERLRYAQGSRVKRYECRYIRDLA